MKLTAQEDELLDALLDSSGVTLKQAVDEDDAEAEPVPYVREEDYLLSPGRRKRKRGAKLFGEPLRDLVRDVVSCTPSRSLCHGPAV